MRSLSTKTVTLHDFFDYTTTPLCVIKQCIDLGRNGNYKIQPIYPTHGIHTHLWVANRVAGARSRLAQLLDLVRSVEKLIMIPSG